MNTQLNTVQEMQEAQRGLLTLIYAGKMTPEVLKQYDATVATLVAELGEDAPCGTIDADLYEMFHTIKDDYFHRGASYAYVRDWLKTSRDIE